MNRAKHFVVFQTLFLLSINLYEYFEDFFCCLDTATDNKYKKVLLRSTQRAWFIIAEWGIKLPGGVSLCLNQNRKAQATGIWV